MSEKRFNLTGRPVDPDSVRLLPHSFCLANTLVVVGDVDPLDMTPIEVAAKDANNQHLKEVVTRKFPGREIRLIEAAADKILEAIAYGFGLSGPSFPALPHTAYSGENTAEDGRNEPDGDRRTGNESSSEDHYITAPVDEKIMPGGSTVEGIHKPIIELVNQLLMDAIRRSATDIHIENFRKEVKVRYKIDGLLYRINTPINKENVLEVISRIKIMSDLDISEHVRPQDGRILFRTRKGAEDHDVPFRVSILPGLHGEDIVLRVLDKSMAPIDLRLLGFTSNDLATYQRLVKNPQGMVLVTGPTGSGKTTTLYATLKEIRNPYNKILSAEDPIEYTLDGVNQKQITLKFGFADMARAFLRHDPDILLIGEIRDEDTADVSVKAAQTGHLILSTLHTNDAISAITRLRTLGVNATMCASSLLGVLSQRLVRRVCRKCKEQYVPEGEVGEVFAKAIGNRKMVKGKGCPECNMTGYKGRIGVFELFVVDAKIQTMIQDEHNLSEIFQVALKNGMNPLVLDAVTKAMDGITTLEEIIRVVPYRQIVMQLAKKYGEC